MLSQTIVFLDKDGTLVQDVPYNVDPEKVVLEKGAASGLRRLAQAGCGFVVISNQAGVARGYFEEDALQGVEAHLRKILQEEAGVTLSGFYYCPHHPQGTVPEYAISCDCRKPNPGMLLRAAKELEIDLAQSWMVGDILNDVEAGNRAGCQTILIDNGDETEWLQGVYREPNFTAGNLEETAEIILRQLNAQNELRPARIGQEPEQASRCKSLLVYKKG